MWAQLITASGFTFYVSRTAPHYLSLCFTPAPVGGTCGGFLCDEMGLGKTLQSLMLIVSNPPPPAWPAASYMAAATEVKAGKLDAIPIKTVCPRIKTRCSVETSPLLMLTAFIDSNLPPTP
jgi:E3 ubiquitin-protein ligase SHPRH